jgi:hypothetical protein
MHEVLRQRVLRRLESLPEAQIYQVLDYIEFLESRYAPDLKAQASGLQRFAEGLEDRLRRKAVNPATLREAFQLIAAADRVLSGVSSAGKQLLNDLGTLTESEERLPAGPPRSGTPRTTPSKPGRTPEPPGGAPDEPPST